MGKTVAQLQTEMSSHEFNEWLAYYKIEPFGSKADDIRHGIAVATLANIHRRPELPAAVPDDFIPWAPRPEKQEPAPLLLDDPNAQTEAMINGMFGGMSVVRAD